MPPTDIQLIPYEPRLMEAVDAYAADMAHLVDDAYTKENPISARKVWDAAERLKGSPAYWGGVVPGVSLDCAGSVMALLVMAGLFTLPPGVLAASAGRGNRHRDMDDGSLVLNRRLAAHMLYFVLTKNTPNVMCIPVRNPATVYPGDIFASPYIAVVQGQQLPPHLAVFVTGTKILTTDVVTKEVKLVNIHDVHVPFTEAAFMDNGQLPLVWRCIDRRHRDSLAEKREALILHRIKEISEESK